MSVPAEVPDERPASWTIEVLRLAALALIFLGQMFVASRIEDKPFGFCFNKPLWYDEFHTLLLVQEPSVADILSKLAKGADYNPPALYVTLWLLTAVTGPVNEVLLRAFSCGVGFVSFIAVYFLLRLRFHWTVASVAVLGMWSSSSILINQMFEGRFYSYWFAVCAVLCLVLNRPTTSRAQLIFAALLSALMCSVHYFGIFTLALIVASEFCFTPRTPWRLLLIGVAFAVGVVTVAAVLPFYFGQKAVLVAEPTWVRPISPMDALEFLKLFVLSCSFSLPIVAYALQKLLTPRDARDTAAPDAEFWNYASLCSLFLLPAVLVVFSFVMQPVHIDRYALPAFLSYAPLSALIIQRLDRLVLAGLGLVFAVVGVSSAATAYADRPDYRQLAVVAESIAEDRPMVVHSSHVAYPLYRYNGLPPQSVRISYLGTPHAATRVGKLERDVSRRMAELFDVPKVLEAEDLAALNEFYLYVREGEQMGYHGWTGEPISLAEPPFGKSSPPLRLFKMSRSRS